MDCPECDEPTVAVAVPEDLREHAPDGADAVALCSNCLSVSRAENATRDPDFTRVSPAFPSDPDDAVRVALLLGLLESLALNRSEIQALSEELERRGVDVFLTLDRLASDPDLDPAVDLERRRPQLEQLLY